MSDKLSPAQRQELIGRLWDQYGKVPFDTTRQTKWSLIGEEDRDSLDGTLFANSWAPDNEPGRCSGCAVWLVTEGDFARHFTVPDARYKNLGDCPNNPRIPNRIAVRIGYHTVSDDCVSSGVWDEVSLDRNDHVFGIFANDDIDSAWWRFADTVDSEAHYFKRNGKPVRK